MRILHFTDIHGKLNNLDKIEQEILQKQKFDLIIFSGDYYSFTVNQLNQQQNQELYIENKLKYLQKYGQLLIVAGNHDQQYISEEFQPKQIGKYQITYQSGSSSTILTPSQKYICDNNFWQGYPFGPLLSDQSGMQKLSQFQEPLAESNKIKILSGQNDSLKVNVNIAQYNECQSINAQIQDKNVIVITHQGPYNSPTSYQSCYGYSFSSGSPMLEKFYQENHDKITLWIHGHSHGPNSQQFEKIVNPGSLSMNNYGIYEINDNHICVNFYKI